jgi:pimeloyl-ACP methyl ester carboxylesterase
VPSPPGYCESESPRPWEYYTLKRIATDFIALLANLGIHRAVFIGHDWGSSIVQRIALWFPENVIAVGVVCVPFVRPEKVFTPLEEVVRKRPNFTYQLWFASPDSERVLSTPGAIETFLKGIFRIKGDAAVPWNVAGNSIEKMGNPSLGKVWENAEVWDYYRKSFQRQESLRGPLTYYKTRELNFRDELGLDGRGIECPALFIGAKQDQALPPSTWRGQSWVKNLEQHSIEGGHWCLVEDGGKEVMPILLKWVAKVSKSSKL